MDRELLVDELTGRWEETRTARDTLVERGAEAVATVLEVLFPRASLGVVVNIKDSLKVTVAAGVLVAAGATPALATIAYVGGGTWDYGAGTATVWSDYYHPDKCHGSTSVGKTIQSDTASKGYWSVTSVQAALYGNETYYKTTC
ncbi:lactococcin 972 family bacteriocin [Streptomyces sp. NPDC001292]|uniref:lactococcin 972 family bacteriocin n=1 Tax=Streptomyces sp. NPDC001292 TaxID=3364558 RepID=UPI0036C8FC86